MESVTEYCTQDAAKHAYGIYGPTCGRLEGRVPAQIQQAEEDERVKNEGEKKFALCEHLAQLKYLK